MPHPLHAATAAPKHRTQNWRIRKPAARGRAGMVVSQAGAAAEAGVLMLDAGGSAADAAVATAFALAAVEPWNSGLGGIGFAQAMAPGGPAETFDFGPVAPAGLDPGAFPLTGRMKQDLFAWPEVEGDRNIHGPLSFVVPSAVEGYALLHERHGRLPLRDVLAPAIALAKRGLPADWYTTLKVAASAAVLRLYPESARIYLPDGLPPIVPYQGTPGFLPLGSLPATLERLAHAGLRDFYEGEVAASIARDAREMGGVLSAADLAGCRARVLPAVEMPWAGRRLMLANGLTAAPTLRRVLEGMEGAASGSEPPPEWYARFARTARAAYAERLAGLGDAEPDGADSCTTHLTACDRDGMVVAMTTTLLSSMGSRVVLPRTGVLMNNGVMWFDPAPGSPNAIAPGKRPLCNMCPVVAADADGRPEIAAGASGGRRILAAVAQALAFVGEFGMDPEEAAHHPRVDVSGPDKVTADDRLPAAVLDRLRADGAPVEAVEHSVMPLNFACPNLVRRWPDGSVAGVSDAMSPWSAAVAQG